MKGNEREVRELIENSMEYATHGTAAVKVNTQPKRAPEPQKQPVRKHKKEQGRKLHRLPSAPFAVKVQVISAICFVASLIIALMVFQAKVADITAQNNKIMNSIENTREEIKVLRNEADSKVTVDDVMRIIEEKGLIKPSESNIIKVNP